jgi:tetratricopeptide (TPR) repeat protein
MASPLPVAVDPIRVSLESLRRLVVFKALARVSDVLSTVSRAMLEKRFGGPAWVEPLVKAKPELQKYEEKLRQLQGGSLDLFYLFLVLQACHAEFFEHERAEQKLTLSDFKRHFSELSESWSLRNLEEHGGLDAQLKGWMETTNLVVGASSAASGFTAQDVQLTFATEFSILAGDLSVLQWRDVMQCVVYDVLAWLERGQCPTAPTPPLSPSLRELVVSRKAEIIAAHKSSEPKHAQIRARTRLCNEGEPDDAKAEEAVVAKLETDRDAILHDPRALIGFVGDCLTLLTPPAPKKGLPPLAEADKVDLLGCNPVTTGRVAPKERFWLDKGEVVKLQAIATRLSGKRDSGGLLEHLNGLCHGSSKGPGELCDMLYVCGIVAYALCPPEADGHDGPLHQAICAYVGPCFTLMERVLRPAVELARSVVTDCLNTVHIIAAPLLIARRQHIVDAHKTSGAGNDVRAITRFCQKDGPKSTLDDATVEFEVGNKLDQACADCAGDRVVLMRLLIATLKRPDLDLLGLGVPLPTPSSSLPDADAIAKTLNAHCGFAPPKTEAVPGLHELGHLREVVRALGAVQCFLTPSEEHAAQLHTIKTLLAAVDTATVDGIVEAIDGGAPTVGCSVPASVIHHQAPSHPLHPRHDLGQRIKELLEQPGAAVVLYGLSGVGKTLLAERCAVGLQSKLRRQFCLRLGTRDNLQREMLKLGMKLIPGLQMPSVEGKDPEQLAAAEEALLQQVVQHIRTSEPSAGCWLLLLDDLPTGADELRSVLDQLGQYQLPAHVSMLMTCPRDDVSLMALSIGGKPVSTLRVKQLEAEEGLALFETVMRGKLVGTNQSKASQVADALAVADVHNAPRRNKLGALLKEYLGGLPLLITGAAVHGAQLLSASPHLTADIVIDSQLLHGKLSGLPHFEGQTRHGLGYKLTAELLFESAPESVRPLLLAVCMLGGRVPTAALHAPDEWWRGSDPSLAGTADVAMRALLPVEADRPDCADVRCRPIAELCTRLSETGLIEVTADESGTEILRLHGAWRCALLETPASAGAVRDATLVAAHISRAGRYSSCAVALRDWCTATETPGLLGPSSAPMLQMLRDHARTLCHVGHALWWSVRGSQQLCVRWMADAAGLGALHERLELAPDSTDDMLATTFLSLARAEAQLGASRLGECHVLLEASLAKLKLAGLAESSLVRDTMRRSGWVCLLRSDYRTARNLYEEALAMEQKVHGDADHADVAASLHGLANVLQCLGEYAEARRRNEESLAMTRKVYGDADHASVAVSLNGLANVLVSLGEYPEARRRQEEALAIKVHGDAGDASVATSLHGLATVHNSLGEYAKARRLYEQSLAMFRKVHGDADHADVAGSLHGLANVLDRLGEYAEARRRREESLAMYRKVHGDADHAEVAASLSGLANVLDFLGEYAAARRRYEESLAMKRKVHGDADHAEVAASLHGLANVLDHLGEYAEARRRYEESLAMHRKVHGDAEAHPSYYRTLTNLCHLCLNRLRDFFAAWAYAKQALLCQTHFPDSCDAQYRIKLMGVIRASMTAIRERGEREDCPCGSGRQYRKCCRKERECPCGSKAVAHSCAVCGGHRA